MHLIIVPLVLHPKCKRTPNEHSFLCILDFYGFTQQRVFLFPPENPSIGCILECRSTSAVVASLLLKGKNLSIDDPEIVLVSSSSFGS